MVLSTKYDFKDLRKDVIIQIADQYPMSLQDIDQVTEDDVPIFQRGRQSCDLPLLGAAFTASVDALLPILFFSGTHQDASAIIKQADVMNRECLHTLIDGKERLDNKVHQLISDLPEYLRRRIGISDCLDVKTCVRKARYSGLSELINSFFFQTRGSDVVTGYLTHVCEHCASSVAKSIDKRREEIWEEIPSYFGYPGWDVMQAKLDEIVNS